MAAMRAIGLSNVRLYDDVRGWPTELGVNLRDYFEYRARVLNTFVEPRLMDAERARNVFYSLKSELQPSAPLPMNKQKDDR